MTTHRLLLVEDDVELLEITARRFKRRGYEVVLVQDSQSAQAALRNARFDAVVIDHSLPDGDGTTLLQILLSELPELAGIILSGHTDPSYRDQALQSGARAYLTKPCSLQALEQAVEQAIRS